MMDISLAEPYRLEEPNFLASYSPANYLDPLNQESSTFGDAPATKSKSYIAQLPPGVGPLAGTITLIFMAVGIFGNLLTVVALLRCPRVRNVAAAFIISLCIADFIFCLTVLPPSAISFINGSWYPGEPLCTLMPFVRYGNVGFSLLSIAMITINRYIMIAHHSVYASIYRPKYIVIMLVFCWLLSFGMQIPTALQKWGLYAYDEYVGTCSIMEDKDKKSSKKALFIIGFICPCLVIICCYARIFWVVHSSEKRMRQHAAKKPKIKDHGTTIKERREAKAKRNEWRITKMVLAIFLSFIICYLPITLVKLFISNSYPFLHMLAYLLLYASACINPIIYVIMNKQYRQAYQTVMMCRRPGFLSGIPGQGSSYGDKSRDENKTMVSHVSIAMTPIRLSDLQQGNDYI
ncbi:G-protein coupled receptor moody [Nilaparvata lugens]|uniref:G-protein coupled receptor moody n=1 Tax=Nilaparvata lugens TaxID=108931 RepID=UPI00193C98B0|nr:G-protein coupled receptor moody [Nilaparvata lugens]